MGFFGRKKPAGDSLKGGADGVFDVLDAAGRLVRYTPADFDEIWTATDEHEAGCHVGLSYGCLSVSDVSIGAPSYAGGIDEPCV